MAYSVVPTNPKTGKVIKRPRKGQSVIFSLLRPRGGLKPLQKFSQPFLKTDIQLINEQVKNTKGMNFVLYQQLTNRKDKKTGLRISKLTGANPRRKQRPLLYVNGIRKRYLDFAFKTGHYKSKFEQGPLYIAKPNKLEPLEIKLEGKTIKETLQGLHVNMKFKDFIVDGFQRALYYTARLRIISPQGEVIEVPVNGSDIPDGFAGKGIINIAGKRKPAMSNPIDRVANMTTKIAYSLRRSIKDQGLRFTSLTQLQVIENKTLREIKKITDKSAIDRAKNGIDKLWTINRTPVTELRQITKKWRVILFIKFELY